MAAGNAGMQNDSLEGGGKKDENVQVTDVRALSRVENCTRERIVDKFKFKRKLVSFSGQEFHHSFLAREKKRKGGGGGRRNLDPFNLPAGSSDKRTYYREEK